MRWVTAIYTAQKMKFFINDLFSKCDQIRNFSRIWKTSFFVQCQKKMHIGSSIKLLDECSPSIFIIYPLTFLYIQEIQMFRTSVEYLGDIPRSWDIAMQ